MRRLFWRRVNAAFVCPQTSADELNLDASTRSDLLPSGVRGDSDRVRAGGQREADPVSDPKPFRPGQRLHQGRTDAKVVVDRREGKHEAVPQTSNSHLVRAVSDQPSGDLTEIYGRHRGGASERL